MKVNQNSGILDALTYSYFDGTTDKVAFQIDRNSNVTIGGVKYPNTDGTANQVLVTDGSGTLAWSTPSTTATAYSGVLPVANGGTGSASQNFVDLTTNQTVAGAKIFSIDAKVNTLNVGKGSGNKTYNTVLGYNALGTTNTADYNTAIGYNTMASNTEGNSNSAFGRLALESNTTGSVNSAFGTLALRENTTGRYNVAVGNQALNHNIDGEQNTAVGTGSLEYNINGSYNTAIGRVSLFRNTSGQKNTGMGFQAGGDNETGNNNSYLGYNSGLGITAGDHNTIIGANVTGLSSTLSSNIIIANGAGGASAIKAQHDGTNWTLSGTTTASGFKTPTGTATQFLMADGSVSSGAAAVREIADEYTSATGVGTEYLTAGKTSFTLTQPPSANSKVKMYVNGIRISNTAYSVSGSTLTYEPANNGGNNLLTTDRVQFDYFY